MQKNGQDPGSGGLAREREKREGAFFYALLVLLRNQQRTALTELCSSLKLKSTFRADPGE